MGVFGFDLTETTVLSALCAALFPIVFYDAAGRLRDRRWLRAALPTYVLLILWITLLKRSTLPARLINLTPFWSYASAGDIQYRYGIYMNIFLFVPFGFLLRYVEGVSTRRAVLMGCVLSVCIELTQYVCCIGLCEFDDVFNNSLGTLLGCGYFRLLRKLDT